MNNFNKILLFSMLLLVFGLAFSEKVIAAEACNKLIEQRGSFEPLTTQAVFLDKIKIQLESRTFIIIASQVLALIILIVTILYFKKRKKSKHKQKKNSF